MTRQPEQRAGVADRDLSGQTALVTGSTSGIGRATALALGRLGADVFVHGRDRDAGEAVVDELTGYGVRSQFVQGDFADVGAVRSVASTVRESTETLDFLLNNAGGLFRTGEVTDVGVEYTFHVNHLAPYLLTAALLDHMAKAGRIVTTASEAHRGVSLDLDEVTSIEGYSPFKAYGRSKLANVQFALALARRLAATGSNVTSNAVHPGAIPGSAFSRFLPAPVPQGMKLLNSAPFVTSVEDGAAALLTLAVSSDLAGVSGRYVSGQRPQTPSMDARDPDAQRALWERSANLLEMEPPLTGAVDTT